MTDVQQLCAELQLHLDMVKSELADLEGGKKSAGPRARKSLQTIKATSQKLRGDIIEKTKAIPTKPRVRKAPTVDIEEALPEPTVPEPTVPEKPRTRKQRVVKK